MVNFYSGFINCTNPNDASLEDVVGTLPKYSLPLLYLNKTVYSYVADRVISLYVM